MFIDVSFRVMWLKKKIFLICGFLLLLSALTSLVFPKSCDLELKENSRKSLKFNATTSNVYELYLRPFKLLNDVIRLNRLYLPVPNVLIYSICFLALYLFYLKRFIWLLKLRYFQLNSASIFRETFSAWPMSSCSSDFAVRKLNKNYVSIKDQIALDWAKWSKGGIAVALAVNLGLICAFVVLTYGAIWSKPNGKIAQSLPDPSLIYVFSALIYFGIQHILSSFLLLLGNRLTYSFM